VEEVLPVVKPAQPEEQTVEVADQRPVVAGIVGLVAVPVVAGTGSGTVAVEGY